MARPSILIVERRGTEKRQLRCIALRCVNIALHCIKLMLRNGAREGRGSGDVTQGGTVRIYEGKARR